MIFNHRQFPTIIIVVGSVGPLRPCIFFFHSSNRFIAFNSESPSLAAGPRARLTGDRLFTMSFSNMLPPITAAHEHETGVKPPPQLMQASQGDPSNANASNQQESPSRTAPPLDTMRAYRACLNCRSRKSKCDLDINGGKIVSTTHRSPIL